MKSAGNDIVALRTVNKQRTLQSRFYSQILCAAEQELYQQPIVATMPFEHYVWLSWSVKESVYKYLKRTITDLVFSPTKIVIEYMNTPDASSMVSGNAHWENNGFGETFYTGKANYGSHIFYFRSKISEEWIATVVNDEEHFENVYWGVQSINETGYDHQSKAARALLLNKLSAFFPGHLRIEKSIVGYPVILQGKQYIPIPVSLAHDDHFVACSFIVDCANNSACC